MSNFFSPRKWSLFQSLATLLAVIMLALQPVAEWAAPVVSKVDVDKSGGVETVILTVSQAVSYDSFALDNPHRLVIDFPTLDWRAPQGLPKGYKGIALKSIRVGTYGAGPFQASEIAECFGW